MRPAPSPCSATTLSPYSADHTLTINASTGNYRATKTVTIVLPPQNVTFDGADVDFSNWGIGVSSLPKSVSVAASNASYPAPPLNGTISGTNAGEFTLVGTGSCTTGTYQCNIQVQFKPTATGARTATLTTQYGNITLRGTGVAAGASFTVSAFPQISLNVGTSSQPASLAVVNNGTTALALTTTPLTGTAATDYTYSSGCGATLASGSSCSILVTFSPTHTGTRTASFTVKDQTSGTTIPVALSATGLAVPPTVSPASLDFGTILSGTNVSKTVTISAVDGNPVSVTPAPNTPASDFLIGSNNTCAVKTPCTISVNFGPAADGSQSASFVVKDSTAVQSSTLAVQGSGGRPTLSYSPSSIAFPSTSTAIQSVYQLVVLQNSGTLPLTLSQLTLSGTGASAFVFSQNTCGTTLVAGANCQVAIIFKPAAAGTFTATLAGTTNDSAHPALSVALSGTGYVPMPDTGLRVSPTSLSFPDTIVGSRSAYQVLTLTNTGTKFITFGGGGSLSSGFTAGYTCSTLQPGESCRINVGFTPANTGLQTGAYTFDLEPFAQAFTVPLSGNGLANFGGPLSASPSSLTFVGYGGTQNVTLTNTGDIATAISTIAVAITNASLPDISTVTHTCGTSLAAHASCTVTVRGSSSGALSIQTSASATPFTVPITVTSAAAGGSSASDMGFGTLAVGKTSAAQLIYGSSGTRGQYSMTASVGGTNASDFSLTSDTSGTTAKLQQVSCSGISGQCTISIYFTPSGTGLRTATVTTDYGSFNVSGVGASSGANFTLTPNNFPTTIVPGYIGFATVANTGTTPLLLAETPSTNLLIGARYAGEDCPRTLRVGESCQVLLSFSFFATGSQTITLTVQDQTSGLTKTLSATATGGAAVSYPTATPNPLAFGYVKSGTSATKTLSVTTVGNHPVSVTLAGDSFSIVDAGTCATQTPCTVGVQYQSSGAGTKTAQFTIVDLVTSGSITSSVTADSGTPAFSITPSSLTFTNITPGTTATQVATITNTGTATATVQSTLAYSKTDYPSYFSITVDSCAAATLAPGATCSITVAFKPNYLNQNSTGLLDVYGPNLTYGAEAYLTGTTPTR